MAASLVFQAITAHSKKLDEKMKNSLSKACNVHQLASLGFILLALTRSPWNVYNFWLLTTATTLFPGVIYYQNVFNGGNKTFLAKHVPKGGMMHMIFWILLGLQYSRINPILIMAA